MSQGYTGDGLSIDNSQQLQKTAFGELQTAVNTAFIQSSGVYNFLPTSN